MSAQIAKLFNPTFYQQTWASTRTKAYAKFHPTTRNNRYVLPMRSFAFLLLGVFSRISQFWVSPKICRKKLYE